MVNIPNNVPDAKRIIIPKNNSKIPSPTSYLLFTNFLISFSKQSNVKHTSCPNKNPSIKYTIE